MADHLHRWRVTKEPLEAICMIGSCEHELTLDEIERRLNAIEKLNAKNSMTVKFWREIWEPAYAAALEEG